MQESEEKGVPGISGEEFISFPMFPKPTRDHLSLRGSAFMEKHRGLESFGIVRAFSGFQEMEIV